MSETNTQQPPTRIGSAEIIIPEGAMDFGNALDRFENEVKRCAEQGQANLLDVTYALSWVREAIAPSARDATANVVAKVACTKCAELRKLLRRADDVLKMMEPPASDCYTNNLESDIAMALEPATPKCPKCGIQMGQQTVPDDGSWHCGNLKCMYHMNADGSEGD